MIGSRVKRRGVACSGRTPVEVFGRETGPVAARVEDDAGVPVAIPPAPAAIGDRGPWEWRADFVEGGDVCSMPFDSYSACQRDADDHARRYLATSGDGFRAITVRRVVH
jgi:hypothetical protein